MGMTLRAHQRRTQDRIVRKKATCHQYIPPKSPVVWPSIRHPTKQMQLERENLPWNLHLLKFPGVAKPFTSFRASSTLHFSTLLAGFNDVSVRFWHDSFILKLLLMWPATVIYLSHGRAQCWGCSDAEGGCKCELPQLINVVFIS